MIEQGRNSLLTGEARGLREREGDEDFVPQLPDCCGNRVRQCVSVISQRYWNAVWAEAQNQTSIGGPIPEPDPARERIVVGRQVKVLVCAFQVRHVANEPFAREHRSLMRSHHRG